METVEPFFGADLKGENNNNLFNFGYVNYTHYVNYYLLLDLIYFTAFFILIVFLPEIVISQIKIEKRQGKKVN